MSNRNNIAIDPRTGVQIRIGVMGSADDEEDPRVIDLCRLLGRTIAECGCCLLTGACSGLPHATVLGAKEASGHVIGVSPASTLKEHIEQFKSPYREYDVLIFTGMGLMGREMINIRTSDIVIVVGGRSGTLGEFAIAYEEGKLIGILTGSGGITEALPAMAHSLAGKRTGAEIIDDPQPQSLVSKLLQRYRSAGYKCPGHPSCGEFNAKDSGG